MTLTLSALLIAASLWIIRLHGHLAAERAETDRVRDQATRFAVRVLDLRKRLARFERSRGAKGRFIKRGEG
jgi:hypothetical protein